MQGTSYRESGGSAISRYVCIHRGQTQTPDYYRHGIFIGGDLCTEDCDCSYCAEDEVCMDTCVDMCVDV